MLIQGKDECALCAICHKRGGRYKCPKCQACYCSVGCYKGHSKECTEAFNEENVIEELKGQKATPEQGSKMRAQLAEMTSIDTKGTQLPANSNR